ncbi:MAG: MFS transporter [Alphaproteobacteria bacterium]|nr:MFS transporter [Alphaproteobacteria bacterium]
MNTAAPVSPARRRVRDGTLYAFGAISAMSIAAVAPSLPDMSRLFAGVPDIDLLARLVVSIPTLLLALAGPAVGFIVERTGRRPLLILALLVYAGAGVVPVFLDDLHAILGSRIALGLGMGVLFTLAPALLADYYDDIPSRRRAIARYAAATASGGVAFVLLGGLLADIHWRAPFLLYAVGLVLLPTMLATVTEPAPQAGPSGEPGSESGPKKTPWLAVFAIYIMVAATGGVFLQMPLNLPFLLESIGVEQASIAGYAIAWPLLLMALLGPLFPKFRARASNAWIYCFIASGLAIGYAVLAGANSLAMVALGLFAFGVGMSQMYPNSNTWLMGLTDPRYRTRVIGGLTTAIYLGQFVLPFVAQPIIRAAGIRDSFLVLVAVLVFFAVAAPLFSTIAARRAPPQPS